MQIPVLIGRNLTEQDDERAPKVAVVNKTFAEKYFPNESVIGKQFSISRQEKIEIVGMVKALELYLNEDHEALAAEWQGRLELISRQVMRVPGVSTAFFVPDIANHVPHMQITWNAAAIALTPKQASQFLRESKPAILMGAGEDRPGLAMNSFMLQPGEDRIVADHLARIFREHSA